MKTPVDTVKGRIVGYDERTQELLIRAHYDDWYTMTKRGYKECLVQPLDARPLSDRQRKMCYALLREISDYTGQDVHSAKEYLKLRFLADDFGETADPVPGAPAGVCGRRTRLHLRLPDRKEVLYYGQTGGAAPHRPGGHGP